MKNHNHKDLQMEKDQERDRVRQIVMDQYLLHEVQHHTLDRTAFPDRTFRIPKAHSPVDIYKCFHQGEFGVGHTLDNPHRFQQRLFEEIKHTRTEEAPHEPLLEDITAAGSQILRVNLRPFKGLFEEDLELGSTQLTQVCFESAEVVRGSTKHFWKTLNLFSELNRAGEIILGGLAFVFPAEIIDRFLAEVQNLTRGLRQIPIYGHSPTFHRLNHPAYRVVARSVLEQSPLAEAIQRGGSAFAKT